MSTPAVAAPMAAFRPAGDLITVDGAVPVTWWRARPNLGDELAPFIVGRMTGMPVCHVKNRPPGLLNDLKALVRRRRRFCYVTVGSIVSWAWDRSIVWGTGSFGSERSVSTRAAYRAVRGPLTRSLLRSLGVDCPPVYGDPGLLLPMLVARPGSTTHRFGLALQHGQSARLRTVVDNDTALIDMGTRDVEGTLARLLACEAIISDSLHALVIADAYGIPSAWLSPSSRNGETFKYYDHFLAVDKVRRPQELDFDTGRLSSAQLAALDYDDRPIAFDAQALLQACPFIDSWRFSPAAAADQQPAHAPAPHGQIGQPLG
jgi:pyruvyltransferase